MTSGDPARGPLPAKPEEIRPGIAEVWRREIWRPANLKDNSARGWLYACLRVLSISVTVFLETKAPSRAAALSFSSLLSLGPLVAIGVLVGGFVLGKDADPGVIASQIGGLLQPEQITGELGDGVGHLADRLNAAVAAAH